MGSPEKGVEHFEEKHELALFTEEEMKKAFTEANFEVIFEKGSITDRGVYYGTKKERPSAKTEKALILLE